MSGTVYRVYCSVGVTHSYPRFPLSRRFMRHDLRFPVLLFVLATG
jgi:hypothetical protein